MSIDFTGINRRLLAAAHTYLETWLPGGKTEGLNYVVRNPRRDDVHPSLKVHIEEGNWKDFASGDGGGDLISLYAYVHGLSQGDAAKALLSEWGMIYGFKLPGAAPSRPDAPNVVSLDEKRQAGRPKWTPLVCAPSGKEPPAEHYKLGKPSWRWRYLTARGEVAGYVYRFDIPGERKQILPLVWAREDRTGREEWRWLGFPRPRPLYGIAKALDAATAPLVVAEGEKAADAAGRLLADYVSVTSQGGAKAAKESDWSPLVNRDVLLWPDNDQEGRDYADTVAAILLGQGCRVRRLKIPGDWPAKFDAADYEVSGRSRDALLQGVETGSLVEAVGRPKANLPPVPDDCPVAEGAEPWPKVFYDAEFSISRGGVVRELAKGHTDMVCLRPIWVDAVSENLYGVAGIVVQFYDRWWRLKKYAFPASKLSESGGVLGQELQAQGLPIVSGKEKWISRYLNAQSVVCAKRIYSVHRMGWVDSLGAPVFVLPTDVIGEPSIPIVYQSADVSTLMDCINQKGTMADWKKHICDEAKGNPFLMFGVLMGLAGALLKPANVEMGGFHFYGLTTGGKTTMLQVAASVWGCGADPQMGPEVTSVRKWSSTASAFESLAEAHNDTLLCLDELEQCSAEELGKNIFLLAGGLSKSRATVTGGLRAVKTWRPMIISSGEKSIRHQMSQAGQEYKGGKAVRIADIPVDGDDGQRSIFKDTHGQEAKYFGRNLKSACARYYGLAGPAFVAGLIADARKVGWDKFCQILEDSLQECEKEIKPKEKGSGVELELSPESSRVLTRFALVVLAGRIANTLGILAWELPEVVQAVWYVRDRWLANLGEALSEQDRALAYLRDAIIANESRIVWLEAPESENPMVQPAVSRVKGLKLGQVRGVIGYRLNDEYGFTTTGFRELCGEYDMQMVLKTLKVKGFLNHDKDKLTRKWPVIPEMGKRPYLYSVSVSLLGDEPEKPPESPLPPMGGEEFQWPF